MNSRKVTAVLMALFIVAGLLSTVAYADGWGKDHMGKEKVDLESKFMKKAGIVLGNETELALTDEQVQKIKDLKTATKKEVIKVNAEVDLISVDINAHMWSDKIDTAATDKLIDKKYDLKKQKSKTLVKACAELKNILTEEQKSELKDIWAKNCRKN